MISVLFTEEEAEAKKPFLTEPLWPEGKCAHCQIEVYELLALLEDAYAVWWGLCPYCHTINALDLGKGDGHGFNSEKMFLILPTLEEVQNNPELKKLAQGKGEITVKKEPSRDH